MSTQSLNSRKMTEREAPVRSVRGCTLLPVRALRSTPTGHSVVPAPPRSQHGRTALKQIGKEIDSSVRFTKHSEVHFLS